jgi:hypothetical protein
MKFGLGLVMVVASLAVAAEAFAGGSSTVGPAACSYANYWCKSADQAVHVCIFDDERPFALVIGESIGSLNIPVTKNSPPPGKVGAPTDYTGSGFDLKICTSCADQTGHLDIPQFQINNMTLSCRLQGK